MEPATLVSEQEKQPPRDKLRNFTAPETLKLSFELPYCPLPVNRDLSQYESCIDWLAGLKKATRASYRTHMRLFCYFYKTNPDALKQLTGEQLQEMIKKYALHLKSVAVQRAGKYKPGELSVNSVPLYLNGVGSLFGDEWEKTVNVKKIKKKLDDTITSPIRGYYVDEIARMYWLADVPDKVLILAERYSGARVGGAAPVQFKDLTLIPEADNKLAFLKIYAGNKKEEYNAVVGWEFLALLQEYKELRESWGERITPYSFIIRNKFSFRKKRTGVPPQKEPLDESTLCRRLRTLMDQAGIDMTNLHPDHSFRHAFETALKNSSADPEFVKLFMGHGNGLSDIYYDETNPQSRQKIVLEYMKGVEALTIDDRYRMKMRIKELERENKNLGGMREEVKELLAWKAQIEREKAGSR